MKVFNADKYSYMDIVKCDDVFYYAFRCIKTNFSPEIVLVREARVDFSDSSRLFFDESVLIHLVDQDINHIRVNLIRSYAKLVDLAEKESKRHTRRICSEVHTLTQY